MSSPAAVEVVEPPKPERKVPFGAPFLALLRRDLTGTRRGAAVTWAKTLAITISSGAALIAYSAADSGGFTADAGTWGAVGVFYGLGLIAMVLAPAIAVGALRREREAGMLDLLLMAGIPPRTLAVARTISTFLFFESLLLAALPATALFWFFRRPSLLELLLGALVLTAFFASLSGVVVAISAWSRNAGIAIALCLVALVAWTTMNVMAALADAPALAPTLLLPAAFGLAEGRHVARLELASGCALQLLVGALGVMVAAAGVSRRPAAARGDVLMEKISPRRFQSVGPWPLSWLTLRTSAGARPLVQAAVIAVPVLALCAMGVESASIVAGSLIVTSFVAAGVLGATQVAPARERRSWDSLLATSLPTTRLFADLLRGTLLGATVPAAVGLGILAVLAAMDPRVGIGSWLLAAAGTLSTMFLVSVVALACSLSARSAAGAISMTALMLLGSLFLTIFSRGAIDHVVPTAPFDTALQVAGVAALACIGALGLLLSLRFPILRRPSQLVLAACALVLALVVTSFLIVESSPWPESGFGWWLPLVVMVVLLGAGIALFLAAPRRRWGFARLAGVILIASCLVAPLALTVVDDEEAGIVAFGGVAAPMVVAGSPLDGLDLDSLAYAAAGVAYHLLLAGAVLAAFWRDREAWVGRAG